MPEGGVLRKDQLERRLHEEKKLIEDGMLKQDNPLDVSENFQRLCEACRRGDLKVCQEMIQEGVNINAKDVYDYTPLILASLCGQYEVVEHLLHSGALCERDTFQGERCLYNALTDRIRNLLLSYDYSKSTDPLQPLAFHITSLLARDHPRTSDLLVTTPSDVFHLHKFVLAARSPYFRNKLASAPETVTWKIPSSIPPQSFSIVLKHLYLGELPRDIGGGPGTGYTDSEVLAGTDRICKHLEIQSLSQLILDSSDRRLARQRRADEIASGRDQLEDWYRNNVLKHKVITDTQISDQIRWDKDNGIFADILLRADDEEEQDEVITGGAGNIEQQYEFRPRTSVLGIPLDAKNNNSRSPSRQRKSHRSVLYPCHKAILIRSDFFLTMFDSQFKEAQDSHHLQIIPIDCSPDVLEIILTFLYTEKADFPLSIAIDVLFGADMLFLEKLKAKAAILISTLGNGNTTREEGEESPLDIFEILRAAWTTRVQRLEEFAARYIANRLEAYIDTPDFAEIVTESAARISVRQETDSIELLDDMRYYLSERFRLRFEDTGLEEVMDEIQQQQQPLAAEVEVKLPERSSTNGQQPPNNGAELQAPEYTGLSSDGLLQAGAIRTLDGEEVDEFDADAVNYQILLGKIDQLLERLKLDA